MQVPASQRRHSSRSPSLTAAYEFNTGPAGSSATRRPTGSTNPLAGQPGFTGTDGGSGFGSWGTVDQVDLSDARPWRAVNGSAIEVRFDIGRDGCGGDDGWYVDNVQVTTCKTGLAPSTVAAVHAPDRPLDLRDGERGQRDRRPARAGTPTGTVTVKEGADHPRHRPPSTRAAEAIGGPAGVDCRSGTHQPDRPLTRATPPTASANGAA